MIELCPEKKRELSYILMAIKVAEILKQAGAIRHKSEIMQFSFSVIEETALREFTVSEKRFYAAKVHLHKDTKQLQEKSRIIIELQRRLKRSLTNDGVDFITSGNVRLQDIIPAKKGQPVKYIFKEKGTDVQLAVDILAGVCDGLIDTVLLLSSDSDMQPVVKEAKKRGSKVVYIGFENAPDLGLSNSCDQTVLLRKQEVIDAWNGKQSRLV